MLIFRADIDVVMWSMGGSGGHAADHPLRLAVPAIWDVVGDCRRRGAVLLAFVGQFTKSIGDDTNLAPIFAFPVGILVHFRGRDVAAKLSRPRSRCSRSPPSPSSAVARSSSPQAPGPCWLYACRPRPWCCCLPVAPSVIFAPLDLRWSALAGFPTASICCIRLRCGAQSAVGLFDRPVCYLTVVPYRSSHPLFSPSFSVSPLAWLSCSLWTAGLNRLRRGRHASCNLLARRIPLSTRELSQYFFLSFLALARPSSSFFAAGPFRRAGRVHQRGDAESGANQFRGLTGLLTPSSLRTQGPIRRGPSIGAAAPAIFRHKHLWLWVPACAGTTDAPHSRLARFSRKV